MKKIRRKIIVIAIICLIITYIVINVVSICSYSAKDEKCKTDVAIVLGAAALRMRFRQFIRKGLIMELLCTKKAM